MLCSLFFLHFIVIENIVNMNMSDSFNSYFVTVIHSSSNTFTSYEILSYNRPIRKTVVPCSCFIVLFFIDSPLKPLLVVSSFVHVYLCVYLTCIYFPWVFFFLAFIMFGCFACIVHVWCQKKTEKGFISPETGITEDFQWSYGYWELNLGPL